MTPILQTLIDGPAGIHYRAAVQYATEAALLLRQWRADQPEPLRRPSSGVKITAAMLRKANACATSVDMFRARWPRGLVITPEIVRDVLIPAGLADIDTTRWATRVMPTPGSLRQAAHMLRYARGGAHLAQQEVGRVRPPWDAAPESVRHACEALGALAYARDIPLEQHGALVDLRSAWRAAWSAYERDVRALDTARREAAVRAWREYAASLEDWLERLNAEWWQAWAEDLLHRNARL